MKKKIKIKFVDFWNDFDIYDNDFYKILSEKYNVEISNQPEYIFYSCFGFKNLDYNCIKIYYTGENIVPDFNNCDYAIGFHYLNFEDRYVRIPLYSLFEYKNKLKIASNIYKMKFDTRDKFCNFIYSNSEADVRRKEFFSLLSKYKRIDSGGMFLNNIGSLVNDKFEFQRAYKFSIAFENSSCSGYTTEKLIDAKAAGSIPIYWGNPDINKEFNTKSFINCHDYDSFAEVIDLVKNIDNDSRLYESYMTAPFYNEGINIENIYENRLRKFLYNIIDKSKNTHSESMQTQIHKNRLKKIRLLEENVLLKKYLDKLFG